MVTFEFDRNEMNTVTQTLTIAINSKQIGVKIKKILNLRV